MSRPVTSCTRKIPFTRPIKRAARPNAHVPRQAPGRWLARRITMPASSPTDIWAAFDTRLRPRGSAGMRAYAAISPRAATAAPARIERLPRVGIAGCIPEEYRTMRATTPYSARGSIRVILDPPRLSRGWPDGTSPGPRRSLDQPAAEGLSHRRGPVRGAELLEDVLEVGLHGVGGDVELLGDVAVGVAERQQLQHLDLPGGQGLGPAVALLGLRQLLGQGHHELGVDDHVAPGPRTDRLHHELSVVVGGEHDHADLGVLVPDAAGRLEAIHLRHPDVEEGDVGLGLLD